MPQWTCALNFKILSSVSCWNALQEHYIISFPEVFITTALYPWPFGKEAAIVCPPFAPFLLGEFHADHRNYTSLDCCHQNFNLRSRNHQDGRHCQDFLCFDHMTCLSYSVLCTYGVQQPKTVFSQCLWMCLKGKKGNKWKGKSNQKSRRSKISKWMNEQMTPPPPTPILWAPQMCVRAGW